MSAPYNSPLLPIRFHLKLGFHLSRTEFKNPFHVSEVIDSPIYTYVCRDASAKLLSLTSNKPNVAEMSIEWLADPVSL